MERFVAGCLVGLLVAAVGFLLVRPRPPGQGAVLGHLRYQVADPAALVTLDEAGKVRLQRPAARAFAAMRAAARMAGVELVPVSGFRDLARQRHLFFGEAAALGQSVQQRAYTCAPPGFSEHHTGYSVDIGDGAHREAQLELRFKDTPAFAWMRANAARFHFEMSFPAGGAQRVAYEPWHWRFVGDPPSFRTFYWARLGSP